MFSITASTEYVLLGYIALYTSDGVMEISGIKISKYGVSMP